MAPAAARLVLVGLYSDGTLVQSTFKGYQTETFVAFILTDSVKDGRKPFAYERFAYIPNHRAEDIPEALRTEAGCVPPLSFLEIQHLFLPLHASKSTRPLTLHLFQVECF